jgi:regulator of sigma E protease
VQAYVAEHRLGPEDPDAVPTPPQTMRAMAALGLGETEYRLNWIPLGGYVKMLGQDDLDPTSLSNDPRSYNMKPIPKRMLIVSAGVLMNVLLAAIGFMIVFLMGFRAPPAEVGGVLNDSPASMAIASDGSRRSLQVGDRILSFNGSHPSDFAKIALATALVKAGDSIPIEVRHPDGQVETLHLTPAVPGGDPQGLLAMGILPPLELRGPDSNTPIEDDLSDRNLFPADIQALKPGEVITAINGQPVAAPDQGDDYWKLNQALADSDGQPITITTRAADGKTRESKVTPHFEGTFGAEDLALAGMTPRAQVGTVLAKSPAVRVVKPGDVIVALRPASSQQTIDNPANIELRDAINGAGQQDQSIVLTLLDPDTGATRVSSPILPNFPVPPDRRGLGIQLGYDEQHTIVAAVAPDSAAAKAGILPGWQITKVAGKDVSNWFQIRRLLAAATVGQPVPVEATTPQGPATVSLDLSQGAIASLRAITFTSDLAAMLHERVELRQTSNPIVAATWGVSETRDFILQFYVTLRRMAGGSVSYKTLLGPVGIVRFGAASAARGMDWLVWFLAMISANLAVANFLPIPVMDGGLFVLLLLEAVQGKPLSANAQRIIQMVGLAIILSIFLLVTYQDITRPFTHG